jgi:hypothetical protein
MLNFIRNVFTPLADEERTSHAVEKKYGRGTTSVRGNVYARLNGALSEKERTELINEARNPVKDDEISKKYK